MNITNLKRRASKVAATLGASLLLAIPIRAATAMATPSCPEGSYAEARAWDGSGYPDALGNGFPGLRVIAPSAVKLTISKPYEINPGSGAFIQVIEIGTTHNATIVAGGVRTVHSGSFTLPAQGYQNVVVSAPDGHEVDAVGVCVVEGGQGEMEHPQGGFTPIPPSAIY